MNDLPGAFHCAAGLVPHTDAQWRLANLIPVYVAQFRVGARNSLDDVLDYLSSSLQIADAAHANNAIIQLLAIQSAALYAVGRAEEARAALRRALSLAEPEGYIRTFIDLGAPIEELQSAFLSDPRSRQSAEGQQLASYVKRLLAAMTGKTPAEAATALSSPGLVEQLSNREMEILRLLSSALSTPEIARELFVSTNTVRSHVKNIYGKLNAHGRIEALQRARELGLLP
jgi:LuxR family maltose regulon positive regulatory protein